MATHEDENHPPAPRIDPARLQSAELIRLVNEWLDKYYIPEECYSEVDQAGDRRLGRDDDEVRSYSTWSVLERAFGGSLDAGNLAAISELISYKSPRWVRRGAASRLSNDSLSSSPDDLDPTHGHSADEIISVAHQNMLKALGELQDALRDIAPFSPNIGGNSPPEDIGVPPYTDEDDRNIRTAILTLQRSPAKPAPISRDIEDAVESIDRTSIKFTEYIGTLGDISARKFAEQIGKTAANAVVGVSLWALLGAKLMEAAQAAYNWLEALRLFG